MECCDDVGKSNRGSQRVIHSCLEHFILLMFSQDNFYQCPSKYLKRIIIIWSSYSQRRLHLGLHLKKQMGRKSKEDYVQLTHFAIEQKLTQHCKATKHQLKKKKSKWEVASQRMCGSGRSLLQAKGIQNTSSGVQLRKEGPGHWERKPADRAQPATKISSWCQLLRHV